jgi:ABC-2 type transport system permease protein
MWHKAALSIELQRRTIYGLDFWIKMLVPPVVQMLVAYYLWDAVFATSGSLEIGGYTFSQMMMYYVVAATVYQMVQPEVGIVLRDIYDGTLTKYLFYPLSFFQFKFITHLAQMLIVSVQLIGALLIYILLFGSDALGNVSVLSVAQGLVICFFSGYLFFIFAAFLEVVGFWVETVWGLVLMLQFVTNLLGGKLLPLSIFPVWLQEVLVWTPFPYMVSFPTKVMLNQVSGHEMIISFAATIAWCCILHAGAKFLWKQGSFNYSGTGM